MNIHFHLDYNTYYGQDLILNVIKGYHNGEKETTEYRNAYYMMDTIGK